MGKEMRGTVVSTADPKNLMRAKVRVTGLWDELPDSALPWAEYRLQIGGAFAPCVVGDGVWVDFPYDGDTRYPRITGMNMDASSGLPNVAAEASGQGEAYTAKAVEGAPAAPVLKPTADYVYKRNGLMEIRSSGGGVAFTHLASGSTIGMNDDGQIYICGQAPIFVYGANDITVKGDSTVSVKAKGDLSLQSDAGISVKAAGNVSISGAQVAITKA